MQTTRILAKKINAVAFDRLPADVVRLAKEAILDSIGVALPGSLSESAAILRDFVYEEGCRGDAAILGQRKKTTAQNAALVNAAMAHVLDCDDVSWSIIGHPAIVSAFPALALGEKLRLSGRDVITAFVAGYETIGAIGRGTCPKFCTQGWHSTATIGTFGAAAAAGRMLGLDDAGMTMAIGIAGSLAAGVKRNMGTMTKHLHAGRAAANGVMAAQLAKRGFTASPEILEGKDGFCAVYAEEYDLGVMTESFCAPYDIGTTGALFKMWPSCYSTHPCIEAMIGLAKEHDLKAADIVKISIGSTPLVNDVLFYHNPKTGFEGKFSNHFCAAVAVVKRRADNEDFSDAVLNLPDVQDLMKKVEMHVDPDLAKEGYILSSEEGPTKTRVAVTLKNGQVLRKEVALAKGSPQRRLSAGEVAAKYDNLAASVLGPAAVAKTRDMILALEKMTDISELMAAYAV